VAVLTVLWAYRDALLAAGLALAYVVEVIAAPGGEDARSAVIDGFPVDATATHVATVAFLMTLAVRVREPLAPLVLAFLPLALSGTGALDASVAMLLGLVITCYSVGAWAGGRSAAIGALGVGAIVGLAVLRAPVSPPAARDVGTALLLLGGAWLIGLAAREVRLARGHPLVRRADRHPTDDGSALAPELQEVAREIRDIVERSLSVVVLQARAGLRSLDREPERARHALDIIEATGTDAIADTQRLVGALLAPGAGVPVASGPSLADLDYLADQVTDAGLPVDLRIEGRVVSLEPEVEALAYRVVHEALASALEHAGPARASVVVRYDADELTLDVSDDGPGIAEDGDGGMADLLAIRGAVAALGGTLDAGPRDRRGYRVEARIPLEPG
jgi:signal transduction histidine kinase